MNKRASGILMHISSLPSPYGIGSFGQAAYDFIDFLYAGKQTYWQILPIGPIGFGESPYQSLSTFGGNPYFIDLDLLAQEDLIDGGDLKDLDWGRDDEKVDYSKVFINKFPLLKKAFYKVRAIYSDKIASFRKKNSWWIEDFALYMALKFNNQQKPWKLWESDLKHRDKSTLVFYKNLLRDEVDFHIFLQYLFFSQWEDLKSYANNKGIKIIGDLPIYVSQDSVDTWVNPELFLFDQCKNPIVVAGCPPDYFSPQGQLWGNPIYDWEEHERQNFSWWIRRIEKNLDLFDVLRLDHFRGLEAYWQIPYGDKTAVDGKWVKGPGYKLIGSIEKSLGKVNIIAEDLGYLSPGAIELKERSGYPGMNILQFAFHPDQESSYLPHNIKANSIVYTGTHDNNTIMGWFEEADPREVNYAVEYLKLNKEEGYNWGMIRGAWSSVANTAIGPIQDFLGLGNNGRMNTPSTTYDNWKWRIKKGDLDGDLAKKIGDLTILYSRNNS